MQNQFSRAHQFLTGLNGKSETALHDAFVAEVQETAGVLVYTDNETAAFHELTLHGISAYGATEAGLFRNWAIHAGRALETRSCQSPRQATH